MTTTHVASTRLGTGGSTAPRYHVDSEVGRLHVVMLHRPDLELRRLTPSNVEEAIRTVQPFGVDVSSGVESSPGIKDVEKVASFVTNARRAFALL